ncbi:MAG TPA: polysaccharide biosynthesis/export family protein [Vicinamibacterales bacterium]|nr:polysaccharide biosynthesis/export family protein [Vicinamibacterales bacterium]
MQLSLPAAFVGLLLTIEPASSLVPWARPALRQSATGTSIGTSSGTTSPAQPADSAAPEGYRLQVGDRIEAKFFYSPQLNETMRVRPDGHVSPLLIPEVQAAGLTVPQLQEVLIQRYSKILRRPEITVTVHEFSPPRIYVAGEVRAPGIVEIRGPLTTLQSIMSAGGFTRDAKSEHVALLRYRDQGGPEFIQVNLKPPFRPDRISDIAVKPFDIVYVPRTRIATVADFFERYVGNIVPLYRNLGLTGWYDLNPTEEIQVVPR